MENQELSKRLAFFAGITGILCIGLKILQRKPQKSQLGQSKVYIGIELGGTGISAVVGTKEFDKNQKIIGVSIIKKQYYQTSDPIANMKEICDQIRSWEEKYGELLQIGIASFGPICLNKQDKDYGSITTTPKEKWKKFNVVRAIQSEFPKVPLKFETDVNAPAKAEFLLGGHKVINSLVYITIGTGVGIGLVINGNTVHGMMHPEGGHMFIPKMAEDEKFSGKCPFHGDKCLEGLISNHSIATRLNCQIEDLQYIPDSSPVWKIIGHYLTICCANLAYIMSPEAIVLGGGVMKRKILYDIVRQNLLSYLNGYLVLYKKDVKDFIQAPGLGDEVGCKAALLL